MRASGCVDRCPACPQRDLSREESEERNNTWLAKELEAWGSALHPILSPSKRWGYRRKALLHARFFEGAWAFGMIKMRGWEEEFIPIPDCPLHHSAMNPALAHLTGLLGGHELPLVYVLVSGGALTLVLKSERQEAWVSLFREWKKGWPLESLWVNWNPGAGKRAVDSRRNEIIFGEEWLLDRGLVHGPSAFRQQIPELEEQALFWAADWLEGSGPIVDLYSGLGASLAKWRESGREAVGVELSGESVAAAMRNAPGAALFRGRVEDRLPQLSEFLFGRNFSVYTNPPRSGHGQEVLDWLLARRPARIAYLSCHPRSLAGDLRALGSGYAVRALRPLDFFPQTGHVETMALLERESSKAKVG